MTEDPGAYQDSGAHPGTPDGFERLWTPHRMIYIQGENKPASSDEHRALVEQSIEALRQIVLRAHSRGIVAIGGTIMPFGASKLYHPDAATEADRQAINAWIRAPGHFDAVIDFDAAMRDPANPSRLDPKLDSGDGLHPSLEGYRAMAAAVPLRLLR